MTRRLQNRISESMLTLPVVLTLTLLAWTCYGWTLSGGLALGSVLLVSYLNLEADAKCGLLRIRSHMIPAVWLMLVAIVPPFHSLSPAVIAVLFLALTIYSLFLTGEKLEPVGYTFRVGLYLSLASLAWPPAFLLLPLILWSQMIFLRTMTLRSFCALLLGCLLPYIFWAVWEISPLASGKLINFDFQLPTLSSHLHLLAAPITEPVKAWAGGGSPLADVWIGLGREYEACGMDLGQLAAAHKDWIHAHILQLSSSLFILLMGFIAFVHYIRNSYDDKISVRMEFYTLLLLQATLTLWMFLAPASWATLFPLLVLVSAPTIAHFFTFTHTWLTNAWFVLCFLIWAFLLLLNCA
ncbi:MAG: hypothetical protein K6F94_05780 [Bacteroidaceae bacterium]|nr:hypothetical protein [Bacteroidaceae bacterium]